MRLTPWLAPALLLAACATPREACLNDADRELRAIDRDRARIETDLARGYAVVVTTDERLVRTTCPVTDDDGDVVFVPCTERETIRDETPIPIDAAEARRRLAELRAARPGAAARAERARGVCIATHPE